ncbi:MAG: Coq4 family protein [Polyangiaceae bacterium]
MRPRWCVASRRLPAARSSSPSGRRSTRARWTSRGCALPADTLGGAYVRYLDDNKLDPDLFQAPPGLPEPLGYIAQRIRQTHDVWHVLTGYRPDVSGELALQGFTYAQLGAPSALLIAALGTLTKSPRSARAVLDGYRRGKSAVFLPVVRFEKMWELPLAEVQRRLGVPPARVAQRSTERMAIAG